MNNPLNFLKKINAAKNSEPLALGLYVEGLSLHAVWLEKHEGQVQFLDAENIILPESLDVEDDEPKISEGTNEIETNEEPLDISSELDKMNAIDPDLEVMDEPEENVEDGPTDITMEIEAETADDGMERDEFQSYTIIRDLLNKYPNRKLKIGLSIPEPQLYYTHFDSTWGLTGKKLNKKIVGELLKQKQGSEAIKPEAMHNLELADSSLLTLTRDSEIGLLTVIDKLRGNLDIRMPQVSVVESAEISLVNLVKENYSFQENEVSVIVYVGTEFSRLIFMQGNKLSHIAPIIGEGIELFFPSEEALSELVNKIRSRMLLQQDNLNISQVHNIILTGGACRKEFEKAFFEWFEEDVKIEPLSLSNLENLTGNKKEFNDLPNYANALGAAWRAIDSSKNGFYNVDLIPFKIREEQKVLKLGAIGWTLLALIFLLTFFFTLKIGQLGQTTGNLESKLLQKKSELAYLQDINTKVEIENKKYTYYVNTFGVLDSLVVGTYTWSSFLKTVTAEAEEVGNIWITEISRFGPKSATLKGYAMDRKKIPAFSDSLANSLLKQVLIQEINSKTVFSFEIEAEVKDRRPEFKNIVMAEAASGNAEKGDSPVSETK